MRVLVGLALAGLCLGAASASPAAGTMPTRKAGWWELKVAITGPTPNPIHQTAHLCTDPAVDAQETPFGINRGGDRCPAPKVVKTAAGWSFTSACKLGSMTVSTEGAARGDLNSHYTVDLTTHIAPPPRPQLATSHVAIDATWLGTCPAGKKPGDIVSTT
ncbi:MAG: DUF3617 domain-containing protein, partial [Caulobacteraceae bacterium]